MSDRRRMDGSRLVTEDTMSRMECAGWLGLFAALTGYAVAVMMGWLANPVSWVLS